MSPPVPTCCDCGEPPAGKASCWNMVPPVLDFVTADAHWFGGAMPLVIEARA